MIINSGPWDWCSGVCGPVYFRCLHCPPKEEQIEIANYLKDNLKRFNRLVEKAEDAIALMKERRTALIYAAVTGKIDVRYWQPSKQKDIQPQDNKEVTA